uniref:Uncharacterized protein n=1 Tax=Anguilla anguilla TaxID=7936 RepID=A0A0E9QEE9_ANGAN
MYLNIMMNHHDFTRNSGLTN